MQTLFAQLGSPAPARVPSLPSPPMLERLFLEQPLTLATLFVALAVIAWIVLNRRARPWAALAAAGALALFAVGVVLLANFVQTDREKMTRATRELVHAAAAGDAATLERLLSEDVRLFSRFRAVNFEIHPSGLDREWILQNDAKVMKQYQVSDPSVRECQAISTGKGVGATQVLVRIQAVPLGDFRITHRSWWRVDWRRHESGQWVATAVQPLDIPLAAVGE